MRTYAHKLILFVIGQLNFLSQVHLFKKILPVFLQQGGGDVGVVSSVSGKMGVAISSSYSASKFALHGYFDAVRAEVHYFSSRRSSIICMHTD
jgi:short-subunit dehydrogenase